MSGSSLYSSIFHYLSEQVKGDDVPLRFSVDDPTEADKDLTSATIKWALKTSDKATEVLNQDSAGVLVQIPAPATGGIVLITLSETVTAALTDELYYDELEVTDANGLTRTVAHGFIPFREGQV